MSVKTFTTEVLTSADTNTYLANSGLVYVTNGTLSTAATNFVGCFTSTFRDYCIVIDRMTTSASTDVWFYVLNGSTPFSSSQYYYAYKASNSAGTNLDTTGAGAAAGFLNVRFNGSNQTAGIAMNIYSPQVAAVTHLTNSSQYAVTGAYASSMGGFSVDNSTVFDGFRIDTRGAATLTGNVTVYGYRQA